MNTKTLRIALPAIAILTVVTVAVVAVAVVTHVIGAAPLVWSYFP